MCMPAAYIASGDVQISQPSCRNATTAPTVQELLVQSESFRQGK